MRTIREEDEVAEFFAKVGKEHPRLLDAWEEGWKWRLARDPFRDATLVPDTDPQAYTIKSSPVMAEYGVPSFTILYYVEENIVAVFAARLTGQ